MNETDRYALGAVALLIASFCSVGRLRTFLALSVTIVGAFGVVAEGSREATRSPAWLVIAALALWTAGLAILRAMLIRSASLQLLAEVGESPARSFESSLHQRLNELREFRLVRQTPGGNTPTALGRLVCTIVVASCRALSITME